MKKTIIDFLSNKKNATYAFVGLLAVLLIPPSFVAFENQQSNDQLGLVLSDDVPVWVDEEHERIHLYFSRSQKNDTGSSLLPFSIGEQDEPTCKMPLSEATADAFKGVKQLNWSRHSPQTITVKTGFWSYNSLTEKQALLRQAPALWAELKDALSACSDLAEADTGELDASDGNSWSVARKLILLERSNEENELWDTEDEYALAAMQLFNDSIRVYTANKCSVEPIKKMPSSNEELERLTGIRGIQNYLIEQYHRPDLIDIDVDDLLMGNYECPTE